MTRSLGGGSSSLRGRIIRQLFPYKPFPLRKTTDQTESNQIIGSDTGVIKQEVPEDGNKEVNSVLWTDAELKKHDEKMRGWARWEVDKGAEVVRSTRCTRLTSNADGVCNECREVSKDESFKADVRKVVFLLLARYIYSQKADVAVQKNKEANLPMPKQAELHVARVKYAPSTLHSVEGRAIQLKLKDPILFGAFQSLEKGDNAAGFLQLYRYAKEGKTKGYDTFTEICDVLADRIRRETSDNENLKYGVRYPANYLNFMTLLRSYGSNSARQYGILTSQMGGPSPRHLRYV